MKTLDEVIKALTICKKPDTNRNCKDCPMPDIHECMGILMTDALHYLRAFRDAKQALDTERDRYAEAVRNCERVENKYKKLVQDLATVGNPDGDHQQLEKARALLQDFYRNEPLDWETLKQMEGKPVWITYEDCKGGWVIVGKTFSLFEKDEPDAYIYMYYLKNKIECSKELYGSYWKAYRKELK